MGIYLVYTGTDLESYMCELEIGDSYLDAIPALGWRTMSRPGVGERDDWHTAKFNGSVQIPVHGKVEIGVSAGELRHVVGGPGDVFVIVDTEGKGHWAQRNGEDPFQAVNIRIAPNWEALKRGFKSWPDNARPFAGVNADGSPANE